jgi:hypothetical protein
MNWKFWERWTKVNPKKEEDIKIEYEPIYKFPCSNKNCLVRPSCTKACDKIIMDEKELMDAFMKYKCCPDCGCENFIEGASGGGAVNVKCRGCGHWFNLALPLFIQRIHISSDGTFQR